MKNAISRCVRMDDWIFEIKTVRALKVDSYGQPYKAIAQLNVNGDFAFIDGTLHATESQFNADDIETFKAMCASLGVEELRFGNEQHLINVNANIKNNESVKTDAHSIARLKMA